MIDKLRKLVNGEGRKKIVNRSKKPWKGIARKGNVANVRESLTLTDISPLYKARQQFRSIAHIPSSSLITPCVLTFVKKKENNGLDPHADIYEKLEGHD